MKKQPVVDEMWRRYAKDIDAPKMTPDQFRLNSIDLKFSEFMKNEQAEPNISKNECFDLMKDVQGTPTHSLYTPANPPTQHLNFCVITQVWIDFWCIRYKYICRHTKLY